MSWGATVIGTGGCSAVWTWPRSLFSGCPEVWLPAPGCAGRAALFYTVDVLLFAPPAFCWIQRLAQACGTKGSANNLALRTLSHLPLAIGQVATWSCALSAQVCRDDENVPAMAKSNVPANLEFAERHTLPALQIALWKMLQIISFKKPRPHQDKAPVATSTNLKP